MINFIKKFKELKIGRSTLSIVLAVAVLLSTVVIGSGIFASAASIWDGSSVAPSEGSGTESDPYLISNGSELYYIIENGGGAGVYYKLVADIYLNDIDKINWATGEVLGGYSPNVWKVNNFNTAFQGNIDGNGYTVYGLYYDCGTDSTRWACWGNGLIPRVLHGTSVFISKLGIDNMYIRGESGVSAFVGCGGSNSSTTNRAKLTFDQCYVGSNVSLKGNDVGIFRGVTRGSDLTVTNSYSLANYNGTASRGFYGNYWDCSVTIKNSYNGNGAFGSEGSPSVTDSYNSLSGNQGTTITTDNMKGLDVFENASKMPLLNANSVFTATEDFPVLSVFVKETESNDGIWNGQTVAPANGSGTENDPYIISTAEEFAYIISSGGKADGYYKLTEDIYLNDVEKVDWNTGVPADGYTPNQWYVNKPFQGNINGNGHVVYGLYSNVKTTAFAFGYEGRGLIPRVNNGTTVTIEKLGVECAYVNGANSASAFVGFAGPTYYDTSAEYATVNIDRCYAGENVTLSGYGAGAFRGGVYKGTTNISNSYSLASVTGTEIGLVGGAWSANVTVNNSYNAKGTLYHSWSSATSSSSKNNYATGYDQDKTSSGEGLVAFYATRISAEKMQGVDVLSAADKMPMLNNDDAYTATATYPVLTVFVDASVETGKVWNGEVAEPTEGAGTENDPYEIATAEQLAYVISTGGNNRFYKLVADIYLNDVEKVNWATGEAAEGYTPNEWYVNTPFSGTIDGNGFVVYGLYYNAKTTSYSFGYEGRGLIPRVNNGATVNISKLGVDCAYVNGVNSASAFVGFSGPTSYNTSAEYAIVNIDRCYAGEKVTLSGYGAGAFRGGVYRGTTNISNSYSLATVTGTEIGLVGGTWSTNVTVNNSYNANGTIYHAWSNATSSSSNNNYATGYDQDKTSSGEGLVAFYATRLSKDNMQGSDALTNENKMYKLNSNGAFVATDSYPVLSDFYDGSSSGGGNEGGGNEGGGDDPGPTGTHSQYWDGETTTAPTMGSGTSKDPYIISTAAELAYVISSGGNAKYYKLANDIYLNDLDKVNWETGEVAEGYIVNSWYNNIPFEGTINGNGNTVYGLYYKTDEAYSFDYEGVGLIPRVNKGKTVSVSKLGVDKAYLKAAHGVAAFVGAAGYSHANDTEGSRATVIIDQCYVGADVTISGFYAAAFRAGGRESNTSVSNSYSLASLTATETKGLVACHWSVSVEIKNVYNAAGPVSTDYYTTSVSITDAYAISAEKYPDDVTVRTAENMQGKDALKNSDKMPTLNKDGKFVATETYPILYVFSDDYVDNTVIEQPGDVWSGTIAEGFAGGTGSESDPFIIETANELAYAIKSNGLGGKYFVITHDIYLNDISDKLWYNSASNKEWIVCSSFNGHIDGQGHIVYGLWFPEETNNTYSGLISGFMKGSIKNLGVRNAQVNAVQFAGGIVGKTVNGGHKTIDSCFVDETVYVTTNNLTNGTGGIVGMAYDMSNSATVSLAISNCYSKARLSGISDNRKNGIIGSSWRTPFTIEDCYSVGYPVYNSTEGGMVTSAYWNYAVGEVNEARPGKALSDYIKDNYCEIGTTNKWTLFTVVDGDKMRGTAAKSSMSGLDFANVWATVEGGTPKLKIFTSISGKDIFSSKESDFYGEGIGTQKDPFVIKTVEHLRYLVESVDTKGKFYKLGNDIYVNDTTDKNWYKKNPEKWYSWSNQDHNFQGTLDGNGHAIYGLYYNEKPNPTESEKKSGYVSHGTGLFPYLNACATIRNLHIRESYITGKGCVGAFAGCLLRGNKGERMQFIACSSDESVKLNGFTVGGIIGAANMGIDLRYCYSTASMTNEGLENRLSGLVGDIWSAQANFLECYTIGYKALFGKAMNVESLYTTVDSVSATILKKSDMYGNNAKKYMPDFTWGTVWYTQNGKTPQLKVVPFGAEEPIYDNGVRNRVWSGKIANAYAGGSGTETDPFLIETPEQLARLVTTDINSGAYYRIIANIKLNDTSYDGWEENARPWYAGMNIFRGFLDGNGHIISGLYYYSDNKQNNDAVGLFQRISQGSVIERLGITDSTLVNIGSYAETYAGAFVGWVDHWQALSGSNLTAPVISECFGSDTVYIEATGAGGLVGGHPSTIVIENCYFTGELTGEYAGALVGNAWGSKGPIIINSFGVTKDRDAIAGGVAMSATAVSEGRTTLENAYIDGPAVGNGLTAVSVLYMKGGNAKQYLKGFNWNKYWKTVDGGTPVLRCFNNAAKYSSSREPSKVRIDFVTFSDQKCEPMYGYPGYTKLTKDMLPIPERYGFVFNGWHHFNPNGAEFDLELYPNYDITLFANWTEVGFSVDFDGELNPDYDYNEGVEIYKNGLANYNPKYVYNGWRSLHVKGDSEVDPMFLVSYENTFEVGKEYNVTFWMTTDTDGASGSVYFVHSNYADVYDEFVGYEEALKFTGLKEGEWKQYSYTFTPNAPYLLIKTSKGVSLFFEDFQAVPTGKDGELGNITFANVSPAPIIGETDNNTTSSNMVVMVIAIAGGVILLAAIATTVIVIRKKKKSN